MEWPITLVLWWQAAYWVVLRRNRLDRAGPERTLSDGPLYVWGSRGRGQSRVVSPCVVSRAERRDPFARAPAAREGSSASSGGTNDGEDWGRPAKDEHRAGLEAVAPAGTLITYQYDFGDSWYHDIDIEDVLPADAEQRYPLCLAGGGACPPEDCGGTWGNAELLEVLADPDHEEHESMLEWVGGALDAEHFDPAASTTRSRTSLPAELERAPAARHAQRPSHPGPAPAVRACQQPPRRAPSANHLQTNFPGRARTRWNYMDGARIKAQVSGTERDGTTRRNTAVRGT